MASEDLSGSRWQVRSSPRLNARVRVAVEWEEGAQPLRKEGFTLNVSRSGCLAVVPHDLSIESRVRLTNLMSKETTEAIIVWKGEQRNEGWEMGIQLTAPEFDFWGLEF